jgi:hypothetical protein
VNPQIGFECNTVIKEFMKIDTSDSHIVDLFEANTGEISKTNVLE